MTVGLRLCVCLSQAVALCQNVCTDQANIDIQALLDVIHLHCILRKLGHKLHSTEISFRGSGGRPMTGAVILLPLRSASGEPNAGGVG